MKRSSFLFLMLLLIAGCSSNNDKVIPKVDIALEILENGNPVEESVSVDATSKITFAAKTNLADEVTTYQWLLNGIALENGSDSELKFECGLSGKLALEITLQDGRDARTEIDLIGPFKDGTFFFGTSFTSLSFLSKDGEYKKNNVYETINGKFEGDSGINDMQFFNNKIYILTPSSSSKKANITVVDAQTLKKIDVITADGFNTTELGEIYNLLVVNDDKAYIGNNKSNENNTSGVHVLNMKDKTFERTPIKGVVGNLGVDGPAWSRMKLIDNKAYIASGNKLQIVDVESDMVVKTISIHENRQILDIITTKNKKSVYILVNGEEDKTNFGWLWGNGAGVTTPATFVEISVTDFSIISETPLTIEDREIKVKGALSASFSVGSPVADEIFFTSRDNNCLIYIFNTKDKTIKLFVDTTADTSAQALNGYMGVDKNGVLYIPYSGVYSYSNEDIIAYDTKTGKLIELPINESLEGEANVFLY